MDNVPPSPPQPPYGQPPYTPPPGQGPYVPPGSQYPGYPGQPQQKGWFGRNCLWFVPVGCLSLLALLAVFGFIIASFVFGLIKSSDPYKEGIARAKASPQVAAALGTPIEEPFIVTGQINVSGDTGTANLTVPISGPKGKGTLFVNGVKSGGKWDYGIMRVKPDNAESINLLDQSP